MWHRAPKQGEDLRGSNSCGPSAFLEAARQALPFQLTGGQEGALQQILADIAKPLPMMRLLQVKQPGVAAVAGILLGIEGVEDPVSAA